MTYIKKLVMKGFKSFARETVLHFDRHTVVVVGPNGSGKSNITDALCFVLGRLSIKSIRAAKAAHLIFSGNKDFKPATHAYVEITLDNEDGTFAIEGKEVVIKREVKKNGQGIYRINHQTKTRQEVIELLSQAGIDPHGFNIVLQGEIEKFVKMHADERRKVIEEVSGISVYEMRKEKSLKELDKTNEKLKQINAVLRERTNYLRNLENEREQALKFKKLEKTVEKCKFSIIKRNLLERDKQLNNTLKNINEKKEDMGKVENRINKTQGEIDDFNAKIEVINKTVQKGAGVEQDSLMKDISQLKQEIAGLNARKENFENQLVELDRRKESLENSVKTTEEDIAIMTKEKGKNKKHDLEKKKTQLDNFEENKRKYYLVKSNLSGVNSQLADKVHQLQNLRNEAHIVLEKIEDLERDVKIKESSEQQKEEIEKLKSGLENNKKLILNKQDLLLEKEKIEAVESGKIDEANKLKKEVGKLDICPLCKTDISEEHIKEVVNHSDKKINSSMNLIKETEINIKKLKEDIDKLRNKISKQETEISDREVSVIKIQTINDRKEQLRRNNGQIKLLEKEIESLSKKKDSFEKMIEMTKISEEDYERLKLEVNELTRSEERNLGIEITSRQRELDRIKLAIKQNIRDKGDITEELAELKESLEGKDEIVAEKEEKAEELKKKYQNMFEEKNKLQDKVRGFESQLIKEQNEKRHKENDMNNFNIEKAQISARIDTLKEELVEFKKDIEFLNIPVDKLRDKLHNAESILSRIGSVNLRALEVYDDIKAEYDKIKEKVDQLGKEQESILRVIGQIDRKKKKTFMETLDNINKLFGRNFSSLSTKGEVSIVPMDKKEIFNAGLDILVKVGPGKYFDVTSLSGGEQTLVSLALIFAIQDLHPYSFYIFDEIDAALDRRNSERLAYLLKKHMKQGQYLIITHNDSIISESSNVLYGVSMQEGISKVLSLEI
ncbi:MAG TPA: chromosome segregation SMC family protein [Candidatus Pacearchaeota archaeon]|nr:chromosome segregation SMC family protein [Candidatus Pacearchaeota archaeon]